MYFNPQQFGPLVHQHLKELRQQAEVERELRKRNEAVSQTFAATPKTLKLDLQPKCEATTA